MLIHNEKEDIISLTKKTEMTNVNPLDAGILKIANNKPPFLSLSIF